MAEENFKSAAEEENFADLLKEHETSARELHVGQKVTGTVIAVGSDSIFLDVGLKEDGVMDLKELSDEEQKKLPQTGDKIEAWVSASSSQGIRLSRSMSGSGAAALEEAMSSGIPVEGRVIETCNGGYHVDVLGKTAFCPGSQIGFINGVENPVGCSIKFLVTRVENRGKNIIVSHRALEERERQESLDKLLAKLSPGDIVEGKVSRITNFGAFLELAPSVEGMIHLSEMAWSRISDPNEIIAVGDNVSAKVLDINKNEKGQVRISLSRKQAIQDPWINLSDALKVGSFVKGIVRRMAPFGAFVEIMPGIEGMVHVSEMSWEKRIAKPEDVLRIGEEISVKIKDIDAAKKRISLSLKDAQGDPWSDVVSRIRPGDIVVGKLENKSPHGLFISIMPGVTGLLPASVLREAKSSQIYNKLESGEDVKVIIKNIDASIRKISLSPVGDEAENEALDLSWKEHVAVNSRASAFDMGIMAQALQKAFQKKQ